MNHAHCRECRHFLQHYILDEQSCTPINCGHCRYPRLKHRHPGSKACDHFETRSNQGNLPDRAGVLHYLTEEFLKSVMNLELPPEKDGTSFRRYLAEDEGFD